MPLPPEFHELARTVRNWGRWGGDDQIGTINLVTPDVRRAAARSVVSGRAFSLALPLDTAQGIQLGIVPRRTNPVRTMTMINQSFTGDPSEFCTSDDTVHMALQAATHWDGLGHASYDGQIYNGYPADSIGAEGASLCGIHHITSLTSRGVLLDVARAKGVDRLEAGYAITADDLDAAEEQAATTVSAGDIVLVRTGHMQFVHEGATESYSGPTATPGTSMQTVPWFHQRDLAAVATDTYAFEVVPGEDPDVFLPVHLLHLVEMGMTQGQNWDLEVLAADCADDGQYTFLLEASPQPFVNAVGSPVNPVAVK